MREHPIEVSGQRSRPSFFALSLGVVVVLSGCLAEPAVTFGPDPKSHADAGTACCENPPTQGAPPVAAPGVTSDAGAATESDAGCARPCGVHDAAPPPPPPPPPPPQCPSTPPPQTDYCCGSTPCVGAKCKDSCDACSQCLPGQTCCAGAHGGDAKSGVFCANDPAACAGGGGD